MACPYMRRTPMRNLNGLREFDSLKIYLASADDVLSWSFGEVTKSETINYRTFRCEREGLFDEKIFGPSKNFECYCGKYKGVRYGGVICDKCGVEVTKSRVRRERMGHIALASPVVHVWLFRGIPSKLALVLDMSPRNVESIIYFASFVVTHVDGSKKAEAISRIEKDLLANKKVLEEDLKKDIKALEKDEGKSSKKEDALKTQERTRKLKQKIAALTNEYDEKIDEQEKMFDLMRKKVEGIEQFSILSDKEYMELCEYVDIFAKLEIGAEAIRNILRELNLSELSAKLREELSSARGQKAKKISKRLRVIEQFRRAEIEPERAVMDLIPVIPPDLRPLVQLEGGRFASSDLNELYRGVINRNNRLKKLLNIGAPGIIVRNEKRMLQEAVDALFDSSKQRRRRKVRRGRSDLRSLADMIKGKQGTFRLNLLGKRVDYSGRGVIINGPELKLNECGIPKEMALELFKPFVIRELLLRGLAPNIKSAKYVLESEDPVVWDILEEIVKDFPVLLNRAPTLWRLGIQAFYPKLIEGNSIRLHLCVCSGFNADFDGDQMAIHIPLSEKAKQEARNVLISSKNLLNPSNGKPMSVPTKIILFGVYYMTSIDKALSPHDYIFSSKEELLYFVESLKKVSLRQLVKVRMGNQIVETTPGRILFNEILPEDFGFVNKTLTRGDVNELLSRTFELEDKTAIVSLIDDVKDLGLKYGTLSGHSVALSDVVIPEAREGIIAKGRKAISDIDRNFKRGLITRDEARRLNEDSWNSVTAEVDDAVWDSLEDDNPIKVLVKSGSTRASRDQVKQIAGVKGLVSDPTGRLVQMPILGNYRRGLSGLEYFVGARGARKGLVDKGLKTADAGYLTRRLVDVSQDVLIREEDCGTDRGREMVVGEGTMLQSFSDRVIGRYLAQSVKSGRKVIVKRGTLLTVKDVEKIEKAKVKKIFIRSPMTCETRRGVCVKCYGTDLISRDLVNIGAAVGVAAAQSIGEPGTQLTMRTFHTGGIAGKDITQGLPRVEEIVEARSPKALSVMSEISGTVSISESGDERKITVIPLDLTAGDLASEYQVDPLAEILVEEGQVVAAGDKLTAGHLDLTELLRITGVSATRKYILDEIQKVYASQGVALNDKHIEIIVRQMFGTVRVDDAGDTDFLAGELVTRSSFEEVNEDVLAKGGNPATAQVTLLGITKASLGTDSFLSAASFIRTSNVLTDAACSGKVDKLLGLKENVIIGRLIPTGERAAAE
jgi:DNA-directed RNA polymerase subunit beta'